MDMYPFAEFGKSMYTIHTIDTYLGFNGQLEIALSFEKSDSVITRLLEVMALMGYPHKLRLPMLQQMSL